MAIPAQATIRASTQEFLEIEDIKDDLVLLRDGSCALILEVSAINFGLLSEEEQDAMIYAYASLLNSLSFPIQIVVISKRKDVSAYLHLLQIQEERTTEERVREQIRKYRDFIEQTVRKSNVLDKNFYLVLPFSAIELGVKGAGRSLFGKGGLPFPKEYILERAKTALLPKKDHLVRQLNRIGLKAFQLNTQTLLELFYDLYNQVLGEQMAQAQDYEKPLVEARFEMPLPPQPSPPTGPEKEEGEKTE
ncbi:hypothetical protein HY439_02855 [Candidatus Microgenomates bacterium]|nr:hypothetical protein [Candidatus Microgenomates bacterium]